MNARQSERTGGSCCFLREASLGETSAVQTSPHILSGDTLWIPNPNFFCCKMFSLNENITFHFLLKMSNPLYFSPQCFINECIFLSEFQVLETYFSMHIHNFVAWIIKFKPIRVHCVENTFAAFIMWVSELSFFCIMALSGKVQLKQVQYGT